MAASPSGSDVLETTARHENDDAEGANTGTEAERGTGNTKASTTGATADEEEALTLTPAQTKKMIAQAVIKKNQQQTIKGTP